MTLYTSDIDAGRKLILKHAAASLCGALFLALFGGIYEHFSFGVFSVYMVYAFVFPLISGLLLLLAAKGKHQPAPRTLFLLHAFTAACSVGCVAAGIIKISGREHPLLIVYPLLAILLGILALISYRRDTKADASPQ